MPAAPAAGLRSAVLTPAAPAGGLRTAVSTPLYTKLKPRPNGPERERVMRHQRARLHGATIAAVAARGYPAITVSELVALAGISRRTFYEHFADREACFLASYDAIVAGAARRGARASRGEGGGPAGSGERNRPAGRGERAGPAGMERAFGALAREIAAEPKATHLALVDILAAGPAGLDRMESTRAAARRTIAQHLCEPDRPPLPPAVVRGIVGGIWHVARRRLLEDRPQELPALTGELLSWTLACGSPAAAELPMGAPTVASIASARSPVMRSAAMRDAGMRNAGMRGCGVQRYKTRGHGIREWAGRATSTPEALLIERYGSGAECFLAALELLTAEALAGVLRDAQRAPDWPTGVQRAIATLMRHVAHDRAFAQIAFVEVSAAGPAGLERGEGLLRSLSELLLRYAPRAQRPSALAAKAAVGGIWEIIHHHVAQRTVQRLPGLAASAAYMVLAPAIGAEEAVRSVRAGS